MFSTKKMIKTTLFCCCISILVAVFFYPKKSFSVDSTNTLIEKLLCDVYQSASSIFKGSLDLVDAYLNYEDNRTIKDTVTYQYNLIQPPGTASPIDDESILIINPITHIIEEEIRAFNGKDALSFCPCINYPTRILFNYKIYQDFIKKFPDPNEKIIYTAIASGNLLQEFLLLQLLYTYYSDIHINIIDLLYPDIYDFERYSKQPSRHIQKKRLTASQYQHQSITQIIDHFQSKVGQLVSELEKKTNKKYTFDVSLYSSGYQYINQEQQKADLITLVDPDLGFFSVAPYPALANVVTVWPPFYKGLSPLIIFIPRHHPLQVYQLKKTIQNKKFMPLVDHLKELAKETEADKHYTPLFVQKLLALSVLPEAKPNSSKAQALNQILQKRNITLSKSIKEWQQVDFERVPARDDFDVIEIAQEIVLLSFASDAMVTYQDILWSNPNASAYILYRQILPNLTQVLVNKQLDTATFTQQDVITPNTGNHLKTLDKEVTDIEDPCPVEDEYDDDEPEKLSDAYVRIM